MIALFSAFFLAGQAWSGALPITPAYEGNCQRPQWSHDGGKIAYEVNFHDRKTIEQYVLTPGQGGPLAIKPVARGSRAVTAGFATGGAGGMVANELSWGPPPDDAFVYSASGSDRDYDLYLYGSSSPLVQAPGADGGPTWSPDGRYIAFTSARTGQGDVYLLDLNGSTAPRRISTTATAAELYIAWSPDSKHLAYVSHNTEGDNIYMVDSLESPQSQVLTSWGRTQTRPTFSPDGRSLAFYSNHQDASRFDLYVLPLGGTPRLVAEKVVMNTTGPTWTPEGRHLVYVVDDDARYDPVYIAPVDQPFRAVTIDTRTVGNGDLDVVTGTNGLIYLAVAAQGLSTDQQRDFKRIYVMQIDTMP